MNLRKEMFCSDFAKLLKTTEHFADLEGLYYTEDTAGEEFVVPVWKQPDGLNRIGSPICVTADSETAIIKDVLKAIE